MIKFMQAASFNYDLLYKVARAISDEVRSKVILMLQSGLDVNPNFLTV
jgi:beta-glucosidase-like glycosyl hydrolase